MADVKISALNSATTPLAGTETIPIVQGGETKKVAVSNVSGFRGLHSLIPLSSGEWTSNLIGGNASAFSNVMTYSEKIICFPYIPNQTISISSLNISVSSVYTAGSVIRLSIYSDLNGKPNDLLLYSSDLSANPIGLKTYNATFTFEAGVTYWFGYQSSNANNTGSINGVSASGSVYIKNNGTSGSLTNKYIFNAPYTSGAPTSLLGVAYAVDSSSNPTIFLIKA